MTICEGSERGQLFELLLPIRIRRNFRKDVLALETSLASKGLKCATSSAKAHLKAQLHVEVRSAPENGADYIPYSTLFYWEFRKIQTW